MKKITFFLVLLFSTTLFAQVTQRNIFAKKYSLDDVKKSLIPLKEYHPYPKTPEEWQAAVPDSVLQEIVKNGEKLLDYKFEAISATISLDYVRSGDRFDFG